MSFKLWFILIIFVIWLLDNMSIHFFSNWGFFLWICDDMVMIIRLKQFSSMLTLLLLFVFTPHCLVIIVRNQSQNACFTFGFWLFNEIIFNNWDWRQCNFLSFKYILIRSFCLLFIIVLIVKKRTHALRFHRFIPISFPQSIVYFSLWS